MRRKHNTSDIPNIALASIRHHIELCEEVVTVTAAWINSGLFSDQQTRNYKQKSYPVFCLIEEKIKEEKTIIKEEHCTVFSESVYQYLSHFTHEAQEEGKKHGEIIAHMLT